MKLGTIISHQGLIHICVSKEGTQCNSVALDVFLNNEALRRNKIYQRLDTQIILQSVSQINSLLVLVFLWDLLTISVGYRQPCPLTF